LVVFLVALPLCLGIALASGAPPLSGIISGIIGGLVIGVLSNSNISVSGSSSWFSRNCLSWNFRFRKF
jgi:MFS superfamily sulfate permease-like transporter